MEFKGDLPPLLVRADADGNRGAGHVMRCLALACAWMDRGGRVLFLSCRPAAYLRRRYQDLGASVIEIGEAYPHPEDLRVTVAVLQATFRANPVSPWVALDGYHFDTSYQTHLRSAGARLLVIDDTAELPCFDADIVLNHALNAGVLDYRCSADARLVLGTQFALIRPEFQRWRHLDRHCPDVARKILVSLGGSDAGNATLKVIEALERLGDRHLEVRVIVGPLNRHLADLERAVTAASENFRLETGGVETAPWMAWADLAIAAGGTTAWELAFMKVPALLLTLADNQLGIVQAIDNFGNARSLGDPERLGVEDIALAVSRLMHDRTSRFQMAEKGRILVDGRGPQRVVNAMRATAAGGGFELRAATAQDALLLWQWANDPVARRNSFASEPITWSAHELWCGQTIGSLDARLWILEYGQIPVGQIRYHRTATNTAQISFSIASAYRGRGFGTKLLELTADRAGRELKVSAVEGVAFVDNLASRRAFTKAGFELVGEKPMAGHACAVFRRHCAPVQTGDSHAA